jgi:hypothetical protein
MTKKMTRRPNLPQETLERARAELRGEITPSASSGVAAPPKIGAPAGTGVRRTATQTAAVRRLPTAEELRQEYDHVARDLRNLGVVAGALFLVIIAAAIIIPALGI